MLRPPAGKLCANSWILRFFSFPEETCRNSWILPPPAGKYVRIIGFFDFSASHQPLPPKITIAVDGKREPGAPLGTQRPGRYFLFSRKNG